MKNLFDRPTKKELINALHYFFLEEIDLNDLKETSNFKLRIALNVEELSMIIKDESYDGSLMEIFLFELASEKLKIDNPTYLKD